MLENVDEVLEMMHIEEEPLIDDEIQPIKTIYKSKSATDFKSFEALHTTVLDIDDQLLLCSDVEMKAGQMCDEPCHSFEMYHRNVNNLTLNVKHKKNSYICHK